MGVVFVQIRCKMGHTYAVGDAIVEREIHSELYSTSGDYDLLLKLHLPEDADVGRFIHDNVHDIEGIERTSTILTFSTIK